MSDTIEALKREIEQEGRELESKKQKLKGMEDEAALNKQAYDKKQAEADELKKKL